MFVGMVDRQKQRQENLSKILKLLYSIYILERLAKFYLLGRLVLETSEH